ncbi:MAG: thioredoxin [Bacteroidales bacterium]|nr:thioredoxin [Bacteroidales bacterium]
MAVIITDANFEELVLKSELPVVLDLWAEWCGPCRMIAPHIEAMAEEFEGRALIGKVDVDSNPQIPTKFTVLNIPTVIFLKNGEMVDKVVGAVPKKVLVETLEKYL